MLRLVGAEHSRCDLCSAERRISLTRFGPVFTLPCRCVGRSTPAHVRPYEVLRRHRQRCKGEAEGEDGGLLALVSGDMPLMSDQPFHERRQLHEVLQATKSAGDDGGAAALDDGRPPLYPRAGCDPTPGSTSPTRPASPKSAAMLSTQPLSSRYGVEPRHIVMVQLHATSDTDSAEVRCVVYATDGVLGSDVMAWLACHAASLDARPELRRMPSVVGVTLQSLPSGVSFPLSQYHALVEVLRDFVSSRNQVAAVSPQLEATSSDAFVSLLLPPLPTRRHYRLLDPASGDDGEGEKQRLKTDEPPIVDLTNSLAAALAESPVLSRLPLRPQQLETMRFAASRGVRALIADEMGTGKTLMALALMHAIDAYPLLVVVPASSRTHWADEAEKWLCLPPDAIQVIWDSNSKPAFDRSHSDGSSGSEDSATSQQQRRLNDGRSTLPRLVVTSYTMAVRLWHTLRSVPWRGVIMDESHVLRCTSFAETTPTPTAAASDGDGGDACPTVEDGAAAVAPATASTSSQRLEAMRHYAASCQHVLLLSGTPSLVRASDLYAQVSLLSPTLLTSSTTTTPLLDFVTNYCVVELSPHLRAGPCVRPAELHTLLRRTVMTRAVKAVALPHLPTKSRRVVRLRISQPQASTREPEASEGEAEEGDTQLLLYQTRYHHAGLAKMHSVAEYVAQLFETIDATDTPLEDGMDSDADDDHGVRTRMPPKIVVFAHHVAVMDGIAAKLMARSIRTLRVDGHVTGPLRAQRIKAFNTDPASPRVALLAVTACGAGIAMPCAHVCVFAEVPPDAGWLSQAEDRLHRPGQTRPVHSIVCLGASSTFDSEHWARIQHHLQSIASVVDNGSSSTNTVPAPAASLVVALETGAFIATARDQLQTRCTHFRVSPHTGRVHGYVLHGAHLMYSGASAHLEDLDASSSTAVEFARVVGALPAGARRILEARDPITLSALRDFAAARAGHTTGSSRRFAPRWPTRVADGFQLPPECLAYGWKVIAPRRPLTQQQQHHSASPTQASPRRSPSPPSVVAAQGFCLGLLRRAGRSAPWDSSWRPLCPQCQGALNVATLPAEITAIRPGDTVRLSSDAELFCSGACRSAFWVARSSAAVRSALEAADGGVCVGCHVNCNTLVNELQCLETIEARMNFLSVYHPALASDATLAATLCANPIKGNCWHGDHMVPVSCGGGEAPLTNLQTLCVVCHKLKTKLEASVRAGAAVP